MNVCVTVHTCVFCCVSLCVGVFVYICTCVHVCMCGHAGVCGRMITYFRYKLSNFKSKVSKECRVFVENIGIANKICTNALFFLLIFEFIMDG